MISKKRIRATIDQFRDDRSRRMRQLPSIGMHTYPGAPTIYYVAPEEDAPSGGLRAIYRHVDVLRTIGISAAVVHPQDGFRCSWFENSTRVISFDALRLRETDLLVVPEYYAVSLGSLPRQARVVIFNQGPHHTFDLLRAIQSAPGAPYTQVHNMEGILTVSHDGAELLRLGFPDFHIGVARNVVDASVFYLDEGSPEQVIRFLPSRRPEELHQILHFLNCRAEVRLGNWKLAALSGLKETEMAVALRLSSIFLSLSDRDGFGMPPAEAMACGSYVVGYHGGGGREYFNSEYCTPAESTTQLLVALVEAMNAPPAWRRERGEKASAHVLGHYTTEGLVADLESFYRGML